MNSLLFSVLAITHYALGEIQTSLPPLYLVLMILTGALTYLVAFLFLPIPAISTEAQRWRQQLNNGLFLIFKART